MNEIEENLCFRNNLEMVEYYEKTKDNGKLFFVASKIDNLCMKIYYDMQIDDGEGEAVICITEEILPVGTCISWGHVNGGYECERIRNDTAFCQRCLYIMEEE